MSAAVSPAFSVLFTGAAAPAETPVILHAGPWRLQFVEGELRYLSLGGREAVRRVYAAVRDGNWNTIPGARSAPEIETSNGGFSIRYTSEHRDGDVDFVWESRVTGTAEGVITWEFDGVARRAFAKNRIGFCLLHPLETCVDQPVEVEHVSGDVAARRFPDLIAPDQPVRGLHDFRRMTYQVTPELAVEIRFEGDTFEMEDQRNWTDASFKTYSTPQRIPLPAQMKEGQRVRQVITLTALGNTEPSPETGATPVIELTGKRLPLPGVGLGMPSHGKAMDDREAERLRALKLTHLRVDLRLARENWRDQLTGAAAEAARVNAGLEAALHLTADVSDEVLNALAELAKTLPAPVTRWLALEEGKPVAGPALLARARKALAASGAPLGAGTDIDFFQFNNNRPAADAADFTFASMRPQAHNFDDAAVIENLAGQEAVTRTALAVCAPLPFVASPVTLKRRWHKGPPRPAHELPPMVDRRQLSLLGASWLTGSLRTLAQAGALSGTWFETTGWRGVMELAEGAPLPGEFPSTPGAVFPMYHVLRAVADFRESDGAPAGEIAELTLTHPLSCQALALTRGAETRLIVANVTPGALTVQLPASAGALRLLDAETAAKTGLEPETFWNAEPSAWAGPALELPPYALAFIDVRPA